MVKILSQTGVSLADVYNVEGSVGAIDQLRTEEVQLVHDMGATIFSERYQATIRRSSAQYPQSDTISQALTDLPRTPTRIHGIDVLTDDASRIAGVFVNVRTSLGVARDFPVWVWDATNNTAVFLVDDGTGTALEILHPVPGLTHNPTMLSGSEPNQNISEIVIRGATTAFGAGTVDIIVLVHISFAAVGGLSSRGLPLPSW